ncbi:MAG: tetratricopeptide repeat protein [Vicinamibacterales bacterium]
MPMRARTLLAAVLMLTPLAAFAQGAPTRVPANPTPEQETVLREAIDLHDKGEFDQAIAKYKAILEKSPTTVAVLYELAYSYLGKKDFAQAMTTARTGAEFKSDLLPMFYDIMASSLDGQGKPEQAVEMYRKGIAIVPPGAAAQLYHNMAVTYRESLKKPVEAREALQKATALDPLQPDANLLLGQLFQTAGYPTPAFLALSTFLLVDPAGGQALPGYGLWRSVLKGGAATNPDGSPAPPGMMRPAPPSKTDLGDFRTFDAQLAPAFAAFSRKLDGGTPEVEALIEQVDQLLGTLPVTPSGPAAQSFVNTHYVPFFVELKRRNFVEPFVYWASQRAPVPGVIDWLKGNEPRVRTFLEWASNYTWPKP